LGSLIARLSSLGCRVDCQDPCHLILCEAAAAACCDAGWDTRNLPLRKGAVFVGHSGGSTLGGEIAYRSLVNEYVELLSSIPGILNSVEDLEELESALLERLQAGRPQRDENGKRLVDAGMSKLFPEVNEFRSFGSASLFAITAAPRARRNTNISMAICINWGRICISAIWNRSVFTEQDCREFLELYKIGWQQWCEAEESKQNRIGTQ